MPKKTCYKDNHTHLEMKKIKIGANFQEYFGNNQVTSIYTDTAVLKSVFCYLAPTEI